MRIIRKFFNFSHWKIAFSQNIKRSQQPYFVCFDGGEFALEHMFCLVECRIIKSYRNPPTQFDSESSRLYKWLNGCGV